MTSIIIDAVPHGRLTTSDMAQLQALFDDEYLGEFGEWDPDQPYGYAPTTFTSSPVSAIRSWVTSVGRGGPSASVRWSS